MGYWIYMTLSCLLVPVILIVIGHVFQNTAPKKINWIYGYRTPMSMKNQNTWEFANRYFGRLAVRLGWIMFALTLIVMLAVIFAGEDTVSIVGTMVVIAQLFPLIGTIPAVEKALKKEFDRDGNRRSAENR